MVGQKWMQCARRHAPMSAEIARLAIEVFRRVHPPEKATHNLTPQERRLLKLLVEGHSYKTAGTEMGVSINTFAFHIENIYGDAAVRERCPVQSMPADSPPHALSGMPLVFQE